MILSSGIFLSIAWKRGLFKTETAAENCEKLLQIPLDFPVFGAIIVSNKALKEKQYALRVHEQRRTHAKAG